MLAMPPSDGFQISVVTWSGRRAKGRGPQCDPLPPSLNSAGHPSLRAHVHADADAVAGVVVRAGDELAAGIFVRHVIPDHARIVAGVGVTAGVVTTVAVVAVV